VQIDGVRNEAEFQLLRNAGVGRIGFPLRLADEEEAISEEDAAAIIRTSPESCLIITFLELAGDIFDFTQQLGVKRLQLRGGIAAHELSNLQLLDPDISITKSLALDTDEPGALEERIHEYAPHVEAFALEMPRPGALPASLREEGPRWTLAHHVVQVSPLPVILSTGLDPGNVQEAIAQVRPAGVAAPQKVEDGRGFKEPDAIGSFVSKARKAFADMPIS